MSLEWNDVVLKDVLSEKGYIRGPFGSALKRAEMKSEGIPVYEQQNAIYDNRIFRYFIDEEKYQSLKRFTTYTDDLIISCSGTVGKVSIIKDNDPKGIISQALLTLRVNKDLILPEFLKYFFSSYEGYNSLVSRSTGSVQVNISKRAVIEQIPLKLPPLDIQQKIVYYLSLIDKKIETNEKINKNLDDILDLLFKEKFINNFSNNPFNWEIKKIKEIPLIITDYVANGSFASLKENVSILDYPDYAYFIRNTDLKSKTFEKFVNKHSYDFLKKSSLFGNEVIISNVGDVGSVFLCPFLDKPMTLGNNMILVKSKDNTLNLNYYLYLLFRSNYGQYLLSTITSGSVQLKFNKTEFKSLELTMPPDEEINSFNELAIPLFEHKKVISSEIEKLQRLRDTLLPKLMSNEIDVSEINCDMIVIINSINNFRFNPSNYLVEVII